MIAAFLLGGFAVLLQLALPLAALHALDTALPARSFETLVLLAGLAFAAQVAALGLSAARGRMLLRAGLWLDHTLGAHTLEMGLRSNADPQAMAADAAAVRQLRKALADGTVLALLDVPWLIGLAGVFTLLDWRLACVAIVAAGLLALRVAFGYRTARTLTRRSTAAIARVDTWWQNVTRMTGLDRLPGNAAQQWERLNRDYVADAYALGARLAAFGDFAQLVRASAQVCVLALGLWLAMSGDATTGLVIAALMLLWRMLEPLERLLATLPEATATRDAWQHLLAVSARDSAAPVADRRALPRLVIGGPLAAGLASVGALFALGSGLAAFTSVGQLAVLAGAPIFEAHATAVYPTRAGISARVLVSEGTHVEKGELIATLDTRAIDSRIASLRLQASTAQIEMRALGDEAAALVAPGAPPLRNRGPLEKLETRIAKLGRQGRDLTHSIAQAEEELARSRILSPVAGRIVGLTARPGMPLEMDMPLATIVAADTSLLGRLLMPFTSASQREARAQPEAPQQIATAYKPAT